MIRIIYFIAIAICSFAFISCTDGTSTMKNETTEETNLSELKVMSFNVRNSAGDTDENKWDNRKEACLAMINDVKPAIIGMQEVKPDQKTFFEDNLKDYIVFGEGRDSSTGTEHGSVCFRNDIFNLKSKGTFWLSETPDVMSKGWDGACYRICTWAKLALKGSDKEIYFFNTHLDHKGIEARKQGFVLIKEKIEEIAGDNAFVILTGDFNMSPDNTNVTSFSAYMNNLRDQFATEVDYNAPTFNNWGTAETIIDYIWYRNANPITYKVINEPYKGVTYLSDHYAIMGVFELPE